MDKISIKGLKIFAYHGVNPEEKINGQYFEIDIDIWTDISKACRTDNLADTVNYAKAIKAIKRVMLESSYNLIEYAAQRISDELFLEFEAIEEVRVTVKKPDAPIKEKFDYVSVCINRKRGDIN